MADSTGAPVLELESLYVKILANADQFNDVCNKVETRVGFLTQTLNTISKSAAGVTQAFNAIGTAAGAFSNINTSALDTVKETFVSTINLVKPDMLMRLASANEKLVTSLSKWEDLGTGKMKVALTAFTSAIDDRVLKRMENLGGVASAMKDLLNQDMVILAAKAGDFRSAMSLLNAGMGQVKDIPQGSLTSLYKLSVALTSISTNRVDVGKWQGIAGALKPIGDFMDRLLTMNSDTGAWANAFSVFDSFTKGLANIGGPVVVPFVNDLGRMEAALSELSVKFFDAAGSASSFVIDVVTGIDGTTAPVGRVFSILKAELSSLANSFIYCANVALAFSQDVKNAAGFASTSFAAGVTPINASLAGLTANAQGVGAAFQAMAVPMSSGVTAVLSSMGSFGYALQAMVAVSPSDITKVVGPLGSLLKVFDITNADNVAKIMRSIGRIGASLSALTAVNETDLVRAGDSLRAFMSSIATIPMTANTEAAVSALSRLGLASKRLGESAAGLRPTINNVNKVVGEFPSPAGRARSSAYDLTGGFRDLGHAARAAEVDLTMLNLSLAAFVGYGIFAFVKFDDELTRVMSHMGDWNQRLRGTLSTAALDISNHSRTSASEVMKGMDVIGSSGLFDPKDMKQFAGAAETFAVAGKMPMEEATRGLVDPMRTLGLVTNDTAKDLTEMKHVSDLLAGTAIITGSSVKQMTEAMGDRFTSQMKAMNVSVEDGIALLGAYSAAQVRGSEASDRAGRFLMELTKENIANRYRWERFGVTVFDAAGKMKPLADILRQIDGRLGHMSTMQQQASLRMMGFENRAIAAIQPLVNYQHKMDELIAQGFTFKDITEKMAEAMRHDLLGQLENLWNKVSNTALLIGNYLGPAVSMLADGLGSLTTAFQHLSPEWQNLIVDLGLVFAGVSLLRPALWLLGTVGSVAVGMLTAPFRLVWSVVSSVAGAIVSVGSLLGSTVMLMGQAIRASVVGIFGMAGTISKAFNSVWYAFGLTWRAARVVVAGVWELTVGLVQDGAKVLRGSARIIGQAVGAVGSFFHAVGLSAVWAMTGIKDTIEVTFTLLEEAIHSIVKGIVTFLLPAVASVASFAQRMAVSFILAIGDIQGTVLILFEYLTEGAVYLVKNLTVGMVSLTKLLAGFVTDVAQGMSGFITSLTAALPGLLLNIVSIISGLVVWMVSLVALVSFFSTIAIGIGQLFGVIVGGIYSAWGAVKEGMAHVGDGLYSMKESVTGMWDQAKEGIASYAGDVVNFGTKLAGFFWHFGANVIAIWEWIRDNWQELANAVGDITAKFIEHVSNDIWVLGEYIIRVGGIAWEGFWGAGMSYMGHAFTFIKDQWQNVMDDMGYIFKVFAENVAKNFASMMNNITSYLMIYHNASANRSWYISSRTGPFSSTEYVKTVTTEADKIYEAEVQKEMKNLPSSAIHGPLEGLDTSKFKTDLGKPGEQWSRTDMVNGVPMVVQGQFPGTGMYKALEDANAEATNALNLLSPKLAKQWEETYAKLHKPLEWFGSKLEGLVNKLFPHLDTTPPKVDELNKWVKKLFGEKSPEVEGGDMVGTQHAGHTFKQISMVRTVIGGPEMETLDYEQLVTMKVISSKMDSQIQATRNNKPLPQLPAVGR